MQLREDKIRMFLSIYNLLWTMALAAVLPFVLLSGNRRLPDRLALHLERVRPGRGRLWVHALSVGEVISALPLIKAIRREYPEREIVFTVTTLQGMEIARRTLKDQVAVLLPMPLDFWWSIDRMIRLIGPQLFILVETDLWPGIILSLRKRGVRSVLVNGRVSPRTLRAWEKCPSVLRILLNGIESCLMQTDLDTDRLLSLGVDDDRVKTAGNMKFDSDFSPMGLEEREEWLKALSLGPEDTLLVAGSTHQGEETVLLDVFSRLCPLFPGLRLIIAPRRIEQSGDICRLSADMGLRPMLRSELGRNENAYDVLVLNTLGELGRVYGLGKISFVGGSLVPVGGHNLLEPAAFGCPVLFGPHTHNFVLMSELLIEAGGGVRIRDADDLFLTLKSLLSDPSRLQDMGERAGHFVEANRGALGRVMNEIARLLKTAREH